MDSNTQVLRIEFLTARSTVWLRFEVASIALFIACCFRLIG